MFARKTRLAIAASVALGFILVIGCSSNSALNTMTPEEPNRDITSYGNHISWGIYQFVCDFETKEVEITTLRAAGFHLNALPFLEPPPFTLLTIENLKFNGDIIDVDVGLRHPYIGMIEFTGFDVCGIVISNGSYSGYGDGDITIAGPGDLYLVNADGQARWWNPDEFPMNPSAPVFGYVDGLLGTEDNIANYNATVNGYKYFADGLEPDDPVTVLDPSQRGLFSHGKKNTRHYTIDTGGALVFNYAIDACWEAPGGPGPWEAPGDFGPGANRKEPYFVDIVETHNSLWHDGTAFGGQLSLDINIYDWFNLDQDWVRIESPGAFTTVELTTATGGGENYSTFQVDLTEVTLPSNEDLMILISAFCEDVGFQDFIPDSTTAAYKVHYAAVADLSPPTAVADAIPKIGFINFAGDFYGDDSTGDIDLYEWDFDGDGTYDWSSPTTGNTTHAYDAEGYYDATLKVSNAGGFGTDSLEIRMIDPLPIISDGNFWDGTEGAWIWAEGGTHGISEHSLEDNHMFKYYVRHYRTLAQNDGGQVRAMQNLNKDVSSYNNLYFNIFFKIITQECPGDGWWAPFGGWGDFPLHIWIFYQNQNDVQRYVHYGYILDDAEASGNGAWEWDLPIFHVYHPYSAYYEYEAYVPQGNPSDDIWQERKTIDLMTLVDDAPKHIDDIWIWSTGWDFEMHWILPWFSDH